MNIAVDFEYYFDDNMQMVPLCVAVSNGEKDHAWWLLDIKQRNNFLAFVKAHKDDIFIAHAIEPAEGRCFYALGLDPTEYHWRDTFLESRVVNNTNKLKEMKHSLVEVSKRLLGVEVDSDHKTAMRQLIIDREYAEHEQEILDYCKSDVRNLLKIADMLACQYVKILRRCKTIFGLTKADPKEALLNIGKISAMYAVIGMRGIPLSKERVMLLRNNAKGCLYAYQQEFADKFPGTYEFRKGKATRKMAHIQTLIGEFSTAKGIDWARTDSGKYSLTEAVLKQYKGTGEFPDQLRTHGKTCRVLASFCKEGDKNWLNNFNSLLNVIRPSLFPYGTQTGRCAAKPKSGFIYTWGKLFRGLIDPAEGYCLVEMDYGSQEVVIGADWSGDDAMLDSYKQKDYYLAFMQKCGKFPLDLALPTEEERALPLYQPYKQMRQLSKGCCLGLGYGMGAEKLAVQMGATKEVAKEYKSSFEKVYKKYTKKRRWLKDDACGRDPSSWCFADGFTYTVFPTTYSVKSINSLLNLPIQGAGSYMLRELVKLCFARGIYLVATVHDAVVALCKVEDKEHVAQQLRLAMIDASEIVTGTRNMKVGNPEYTFHGTPNAHGGEKEWEALVKMLKDSAHVNDIPDTFELFDLDSPLE